jgi:hypothetical protein
MTTSATNRAGSYYGTILLTILLPVLGAHPARAGDTAAPAAKRMSCAHRTAVLRERLEPVIEAVIDGKPERTGKTTSRAEQWWARHGAELKAQPGADSLLQAMAAAGGKGQSLEAARDAAILATRSLDWCPGRVRTADRLMRLDLFGMAAWLRTRGETIPLPGGVEKTAKIIVKSLVAKGNQALASELELSITAVQAANSAGSKDPAQAKALLDLIDKVEGATK